MIDLMVNSEGGLRPQHPRRRRRNPGIWRPGRLNTALLTAGLSKIRVMLLARLGSFAEYMKTMPGGGFERFLKDSVTSVVIDVIKIIKKQSVNLYVNLLADGVGVGAFHIR